MAAEFSWTEEVKLSGGVAVGGLAIDLLGDTVKGFLEKFVPAEWIEVAVEIVIGAVLIYIGYKWVGKDWSDFVKQAGRGALGAGIKDIVKPYVVKK